MARWLAPLLLLTGCFDFNVEQEVTDLRVLAVQVEPPEVFVDSAAPGLVVGVRTDPQPVQVRVLAVNPASDAELRYSVVACVHDDTLRCDEQPHTTVPVAEGSARPDGFEFDFAPTAAQLNAWQPDDQFLGFGGLYVTLSIRVDQPGEPTVWAAKLVTYNSPNVLPGAGQDPPPPKTPNRNPELTALKIAGTPTIERGPIEVGRGDEVLLEPIFHEGATVEEYVVPLFPDPETRTLGGYRVLTEAISFDFYATAGGFDAGTLRTRDVTGDAEELEATWTAPDEVGEQRLWVVVRDDRGGTSWVERVFAVR